MAMYLECLLLLSMPYLTYTQTTARTFTGNDYVLQRFSAEGMQNVYKLKGDWLKESNLPLNSGFDDHLDWTPKQKLYFQSLGERSYPQNPLVKKEFRQLSDEERDRFFLALKRMRHQRPDPKSPRSEYDILVSIHTNDISPGAHMGAAFLPWHREYNYRFERALRKYDSTVTIPYWDPSLDARLDNPDDTYLFSQELLGTGKGYIKSGYLAFWPVTKNCYDFGPFLQRDINNNPAANLLNDSDFNHILSPMKSKFVDIVSFVDETMEMGHGHIHEWIGGHFNNITCSPQDPIFWMLHSLLDCLWEEYKIGFQNTSLETDYPTHKDGNIGTKAHKASGKMIPFAPWVNIDGLSSYYTNNYYKCGKRPVNCQKVADCQSKYIWCDTTNKKCMPKLKIGASCTGYPDVACYKGTCANSICKVKKTPKHNK